MLGEAWASNAMARMLLDERARFADLVKSFIRWTRVTPSTAP
jgi:hypothetical protein